MSRGGHRQSRRRLTLSDSEPLCRRSPPPRNIRSSSATTGRRGRPAKRIRRQPRPIRGGKLAVFFLALAGTAHGGGPPHAHEAAVGLWECDRGLVMRARSRASVCVPESEVSDEPEVIVSDLPSAGDGAPVTWGRSVVPAPLAATSSR